MLRCLEGFLDCGAVFPGDMVSDRRILAGSRRERQTCERLANVHERAVFALAEFDPVSWGRELEAITAPPAKTDNDNSLPVLRHTKGGGVQ